MQRLKEKARHALQLEPCVYDKCVTTNVWKIFNFFCQDSEEALKKIKETGLNYSRFLPEKNIFITFVYKLTSPYVCLAGAYSANL